MESTGSPLQSGERTTFVCPPPHPPCIAAWCTPKYGCQLPHWLDWARRSHFWSEDLWVVAARRKQADVASVAPPSFTCARLFCAICCLYPLATEGWKYDADERLVRFRSGPLQDVQRDVGLR
jgi:hypothetical protein